MSTEILQPQAVIVPLAQSTASLLNLRQKSFVDNLLQVKIKWKAAELAGYAGDMYQLAVTANELLKNPKVRAYYDECLEAMHCSQAEVLAELGEIAKAPWREFIEVKTDFVTGEVVNVKLQLKEKLKALELVGKAHGTFIDKTEVNLSDSGAAQVAEQFFALVQQAAMKRAEALNQPQLEAASITPTPDSE